MAGAGLQARLRLCEDFAISINGILRTKYGRRIAAARRKIRAETLGSEEAGLLKSNEGDAVLVVVVITSDPYGVPMEHLRATFRADRYEIDMAIRATT